MKIIWKLFTIAFLYCLFVSDLLPTILTLFLVKAYSQSATTITLLLTFLTVPLILIEFGIFYMVGKNHDLKKSLVSSIVTIYFGSAIGLIAATVLLIIVYPYFGAIEIINGTYLAFAFGHSLMDALSHLFTDIAGLAVSNMRHNTTII
jgi:cytochrome c biogenesis factor